MRALTGLDLAAFCALAEPFVAACQQEADARFSEQRPRQRRAGSGRKGVLTSLEQKLLFILYYLKAYPTFDVLAASFGLPRSKACEHAHHLAKALERTLRTLGVLSARAIDSLAQLQALATQPAFYDYEKSFEAIWMEPGRQVLERNVGPVPADRRKKKMTTRFGPIQIANSQAFSHHPNEF